MKCHSNNVLKKKHNSLNSKTKLSIIGVLFLIIIGVGVVDAVGTYPAVDPDMVLYYHFNNDSTKGENYSNSNGDKIADYSNFGNNGTLVNGTFNVTGGYLDDGAFEFDGYNNHQILLSNKELNYTYGTVAFWYKRKGSLANNWLFSYGNATTTSYFDIFYSSSNYLHIQGEIAGSTYISLVSPSSIAINYWHYVVITYDGINTTLYLDGQFANTTEGGMFLKNVSNTASDLKLGLRGDSSGDLNGSIDDIIIYNRSLEDYEVLDNYVNYFNNCNGDLTQGGEFCYISTSLTLNGTYSKSMNTSNIGVLIVNGNNILFDCNYSYIYGNSSSYGIYINGKDNITIRNCRLSNFVFDIAGYKSKNMFIYNNNLTPVFNTGSGVSMSTNCKDYNISNNVIYGGFKGINVGIGTSINAYVGYNNISNADIGIYFKESNHTIIEGNIIFNSTMGYDAFYSGIFGERRNYNYTIKGNLVNYSGTVGIGVRGYNNTLADNGRIINNVVSNIPYSLRITSFFSRDFGEPNTCIGLYSMYKGYSGDGKARPNWTENEVYPYSANNTFIENNTLLFCDVLLRDQGINTTHDIVAYNITQNWIYPDETFYFNDNFQNLSSSIYKGVLTNILSNNLQTQYIYNYSLSRSSRYYLNGGIYNKTLNLSLIRALIYNSNFSIQKEISSNINLNTGLINFTILPGNSSYILNDYNITQNAPSRSNDPIWFTSASDNTTKYIASNLSDTINVTAIIDVDDCDIQYFTYTSDSGNYSYTYTSDGEHGADYAWTSCSNGKLQFELYNLEKATGSNKVIITYNDDIDSSCNALQQAFGSFGALFGLIALGVVIYFALSLILGYDIDVKLFLVGAAVALVVGAIILVTGIVFLSTLC